jgi:hypothetical protein
MQSIERKLTDRHAERLRAQRQREEVIHMIRDLELRDLYEDLQELLSKIPQADCDKGFIPKLLTSCLTFARAIDRLQERESINVQDLRHEIRSLRADLAAVQALIKR